VFTVAGLLGKESAALNKFYISLIEYFVFQFEKHTTRERLRLHALLIVFALVPIITGILYFITHTHALLHDYVMRPFSLTERLASESIIMWRYLDLLLLPRLSTLTLYHDGIAIRGLTSPLFLLATSGWIIAIGLMITIRNRFPILVFGFFFFLVSHLLESTILPLELMFEHRNYIGSIGIMLGVIALLLALRNLLPRLQPVLLITFIAITSGFGLMQVARASTWASPYAFALVSAKEHHESARAVSMLANYQARRGYLEEAQGLIRTAIDERQHNRALPGLYLHLLMFHCEEETTPRELLDQSRRVMSENPVDSYALSGLKVLRQRILDGHCPALTREDLLPLEKTAAENARTRREYRFFFHGMVGVTNAELGNLQESRSYLLQALEYADSVSRETRREHAITLAQVCIGLKDRECTDMALKRARRIDDEVGGLIGKHKAIPALESLSRQIFSDSSN
jgi:hypothetical protein